MPEFQVFSSVNYTQGLTNKRPKSAIAFTETNEISIHSNEIGMQIKELSRHVFLKISLQ